MSPRLSRAIPILLLLSLTAPAGLAQPSWKPEAADLLFASGRDGNSEVYVLRAGQREWTNLTLHEAGDNWPVWSPDGSRIAFQSRRQGNLDIWVMAADGSNQRQLTTDPADEAQPCWSVGGYIYYTRKASETSSHIFRIKAPAA